MEQDYLDYTEEKTENSESEQPKSRRKSDFYMAIFVLQSVICAAILLFCLITKTFFGDFFNEVKVWYNKNLNDDTNVSLVLGNTSEASGTGGPLEVGDIDLSGGFVIPVAGKLTSGYGYRIDPFTGDRSIHSGVDIAAAEGTAIKATLSGFVERAEKSDGDYGNYIIINHGGFKTLYAHCADLKASTGQRVLAGTTVATVGSTGRSTGPHLHFELRIGDVRIDPTPFVVENK